MDFRHDPKSDFAPIETLDQDRAKAEIEALRDGVADHDHRYHMADDPVISDAVYDQLFQRLAALEDAFPALGSDTSPTRRVGAAPSKGLERVPHDAPMLSLEAAFERADVRAFVARIDGRSGLVLEPKFDGLSVELIDEQGRYVRAASRGDGREGDDITDNAAVLGRLRGAGRQGHPARAGEVSGQAWAWWAQPSPVGAASAAGRSPRRSPGSGQGSRRRSNLLPGQPGPCGRGPLVRTLRPDARGADRR
ncbi:MAG: hypothetical protein EA356_00775, partial [Geminicoccaceae bacterium]